MGVSDLLNSRIAEEEEEEEEKKGRESLQDTCKCPAVFVS